MNPSVIFAHTRSRKRVLHSVKDRNQSTPDVQRHRESKQNHHRYQNHYFNHSRHTQRRNLNDNRWSNNSPSSYNSNLINNSQHGEDNRMNIDAYLHPSMLQDPWESLRQERCSGSSI